jgi:hypothetical protein
MLYPCSSEAVEEVGLACYLAILEVCIAQFAYINLYIVSSLYKILFD